MRNTIITIVVLIIIILGFTLYWQFWGSGQDASNQAAQVINSQTPDQTEKVIVTGMHQFSNGRHIIAGEVDLPTPCHLLNHEVIVAESFPEQVTINFSTAITDAVICAQVITSSRYKIEFDASENAGIKATWNGVPAQLNLIPVGPGEDLNQFDIFIKG